MPKWVLISGGAGFVGRNLCYALLSPATEIVMVDELSARMTALGVANRVSGGSRAGTLLGWKPKVDLRDGMERVIRHARWRLENGYAPEG